jgi:hypothetical protein
MDNFLLMNHVKEQCVKLKEKHWVLLVPIQYIVLFMNFTVSNEDNFQIRLYIVLIQGIRTIFIDHVPAFHVFRRMHSVLASKFSAVYHLVSRVLRTKTPNFK